MAEEKFLTRREFITALTAIGGSAAVAIALSEIEPLAELIQRELALELPEVRREVAHARGKARHHWAMLIDLRKCIGCQYCVYACQAVNNVPDDMRWNVYIPEVTQTGVPFHMTRPCMHCQDAPCTAVCPTRATWVRDDGIVIMDYSLCIGCRYVRVACPQRRTFNWKARGRQRLSGNGARPIEPAARRRKVYVLRAPYRSRAGAGTNPGEDRPRFRLRQHLPGRGGLWDPTTRTAVFPA